MAPDEARTPVAPLFRAGRDAFDGRPTYLLVHGLGLSHLSFGRLARVLASQGTVLAPDLPGFGVAPPPERRLSVTEYADAVEESVGHREGPLILVGHSLGSQIVLELALRRPDIVAGVVLVGAIVDPAAPTLVGQGLRLLRDYGGEPPRTLLMVARSYLRGGFAQFLAGARSMLEYPTADRIGGLGTPLLVLRGASDPIAPEGWSAWLASQVDRGRHGSIPGARHNVVHSAPAIIGREIVAFASGLVTEPRR